MPTSLTSLPPEIISLIAGHLPRANDLANLSRTSRRLRETIAAEDWRIFYVFVTTRFPGIETPPFWKEATRALTSRARALDKNAVVGRFVYPPPEAVKIGRQQAQRGDNPTHGYRPALDSYEEWNGTSWNERREVLAWGAADQLILRVAQSGPHPQKKWLIFNDLENISSLDDICGVHLLRPDHHAKVAWKEHVIFARMRGDLVHVSIDPERASYECQQKFLTSGQGIECIDMGPGNHPALAAHLNDGSILFFSTTSDEETVRPFARLGIDPDNVSSRLARSRYSKFLSPHSFAVGTGRINDAISISTVTESRLLLDREISAECVDFERVSHDAPIKSHVNAIAPLSPTGQVFLAAWGDRAVRLHDLRSSQAFEQTYRDTTDQNPIYCVQPFGHDRFVVGSGGNALLKIFDLRMTNEETYRYREPRPSPPTRHERLLSHMSHLSISAHSHDHRFNHSNNTFSHPRKDLSLFLSHQPPTPNNTNRNNTPRTRRIHRDHPYRGAIYSMTTPSPSSPTLYTGVADGVTRLDFASTDDLYGPHRDWYRNPLSLYPDSQIPVRPADRILELSGYERPESTTASLKLRTQQTFGAIRPSDVVNEQVTGWDRRWEKLEAPGSWRRHD
ncbi:F-box domain protein [Aspergillus ellipticus CBS 707.79]|uniref:F-box domain protein n=1 Tax=Aspergillus ellipticus CBS 707.79 TaxID=1448320 RepID=A0A319D9R6_9EURO|nr:F-box domain protein [Aspergillus ellipticus CBS 707.79]